MDFNIVLADRRQHTRCFDDVMTACVHGLRNLGHTAVNTSAFDPDRINVVFGYYFTKDRFPERSIIYQLEPVCDPLLANNFHVPVKDLRRHLVWDYSRYNVERLRQLGVEAHYVPIGHHPVLQRVAAVPEQDIDVLFYGDPAPRRRAILSELDRRGLRTECAVHIYGEDLDPLIARAKVVLNMHKANQYHPLESVRVGYLLSNRKAVVAEVNHNDDADDLGGGIAAVPLPRLVDTCVDLVRDDKARTELADKGFAVISRRPITGILDGVLHTAEALDPLAGAWGPRC